MASPIPPVLATLTGLEELELNGNTLTDVPFLPASPISPGLDLAYTVLVDMSSVTNLNRLNWVNVGENRSDRSPDLSPFTNVITFMMAGNRSTTCRAVTRLPGPRGIAPSALPVHQDLSPLTNCPHLERCCLRQPAITDLAVLGASPALRC